MTVALARLMTSGRVELLRSSGLKRTARNTVPLFRDGWAMPMPWAAAVLTPIVKAAYVEARAATPAVIRRTGRRRVRSGTATGTGAGAAAAARETTSVA